MKILFINYEYPPLGGGGGIETQDLAVELALHHQVYVLTTGFGNLPAKELKNGVNIYRVPVLGRTDLPTATLISLITFFPTAFFYGLFLIPKIRPQVINAHFVVPSGLPAAFLAKIFKIPFVLTLIGGDVYDPSKGTSPHRHAILRWTIRRIMRCADRLTAISNDTKERAIRHYRATEGIEVIPLGFVPPAEPSLAVKNNVDYMSEKPLHFATIGRLVPRKGYFDLLGSFARMDDKKAMLDIMGDGPLFSEMKDEISKLGIDNRVVLHGRVSDQKKYDILRQADIYVSTSHHEGFGICFLEAMYAGLPIIAPNIGGQSDFLASGRNALIVAVSDLEKITKAMNQMVSDSNLRREMGENNKRDVEKYLIHNTAKSYELIFEDIISS